MLKWCSYCQKFLGEKEPLDNYAISHGMCVSCEAKSFEKLDAEMEGNLRLTGLHRQLMEAGLKQDKQLARRAVTQAMREGVHGIDILMGIIAPILWEVGDLWSAGTISVADEHRFTSFFDAIIVEMNENHLNRQPSEKSGNVDILLVNAPRNFHHLGLQCLNLWLQSKNVHSVLHATTCSPTTLFPQIRTLRPRFVGFSVALSEQIPATLSMCKEIRKEFVSNAPILFLGGSAIKKDSRQINEDVICLHDINQLLDLVKTGQAMQEVQANFCVS